MAARDRSRESLRQENEDLRAKLAEAEEILRAIRNNEVDALIVSGPDSEQIYTLKGAEHPYRVLVETMNEGAVTLVTGHDVFHCNQKFAAMLRAPLEQVIGSDITRFIAPDDLPTFEALIRQAGRGHSRAEITLRAADGTSVPVLLAFSPLHLDEVDGICLVATDLTEQKEIVAAEKLARSILEQAAEAIVVCDAEGRIIRASRQARQLCGNALLEQRFDEALRLRLVPEGQPESRDGCQADDSQFFSLDAVLRGEACRGVEVTFARPGDQVCHLLANAGPLVSGDQRVVGCVVTLTDISERKQTEQALSTSEGRLRLALDAAQMGTWEWNAGTDRIIEDDRARQLIGASGGLASLIERIHPDDRAQVARELKRAFAEEANYHAEFRVTRPDGGWHWMEVSAQLNSDASGRPARAIGVVRDVTERKQTEIALRSSQERLSAALFAADTGTFRWHIRTNELEWDENLDRLFSLPPGETARSLEDLTTRVHPDDRAEVIRLCERCAAEGADFDMEFRVILPDGGVRWLDDKGKTFFGEDGSPLYMTGACVDITRRKRAEAEREELLAREQEARAAAEAANRSKDEFLTVVSHELRSPLNAILGYTHLLRTGQPDLQQIRRCTEIVERSAKTQLQIIEDLLDTARIISGKLRLEIRPVNLVSVIEQALDVVRPAADSKGLELAAALDPEAGQITGDPERLQQVVWNMLSNAVKYTPPGGRVEVRLARVDPHIQITVSDTGRGIKPDFLPHVFDRFWQQDSSSTRRHGGLGLGLSLVRHLVELHGGTIEATSPGEGMGATFTVNLPVRAVYTATDVDGQTPLVIEGVTGEQSLAGIWALVVDDEAEARELLTFSLEQHGARVTAAASAAEALPVLRQANGSRPDVLISDIGMPDEDGYNLIGKVRQWEQRHGGRIPAVALTAYSRTEDRLRALVAGFQMHVAKPVEPDELAVVIRSLAGRAGFKSPGPPPPDRSQ